MSEKTKNHYIPQFYLRNWTNQDKKLFRYDLITNSEKYPLWTLRSPAVIATIDDLYAREENGIKVVDTENSFADICESPISPIITKMINHGYPSEDELVKIEKFILLQRIRTVPGIERINKIMPEIIDNGFSELSNAFKDYDKAKNYMFSSDGQDDIWGKRIPLKFTMPDDPNSPEPMLKVETIIGKSYWLYALDLFLSNDRYAMSAFKGYKWSICIVHPDVLIPTSDDPVVVAIRTETTEYELVERTDIFPINSRVYLPLNPSVVLVGSQNNSLPRYFNATKTQSLKIKQLIVNNAYRYIYSNFEDSTITNFRKRIVDKAEYDKFQQVEIDFIKQYEEEKEYLQHG